MSNSIFFTDIRGDVFQDIEGLEVWVGNLYGKTLLEFIAEREAILKLKDEPEEPVFCPYI